MNDVGQPGAAPGPGYRPGAWWVPDQNLAYPDPPGRPRPRTIGFFDVTLREGPQHFPIILDAPAMQRLAEETYAVGIRRFDVWPVVSEASREAAAWIPAHLPDARVYCPYRPTAEIDLTLALARGAHGVVMLAPMPQPPVLARPDAPDYGRQLDVLWAAIHRARQHGLRVVLGTGAVFRAPLDGLERLYRGAVAAGVDSVTIADSFGHAAPWAVEALVRQVRTWVGSDIGIEIHCHNDLGLATANSLAAVRAGADTIHTAVNGYGERAGNTALDEAAVGVEAVLGLESGLDLARLTHLSRVAAEITGVPLPHAKPVTGAWQSVEWTGLQVDWRQQARAAGYPEGWYAILPEVVGADPARLELGPMVGASLLRLKVQQLGLSLPDAALSALRDRVKQQTTRQRAPLTDDDFRQMVAELAAPVTAAGVEA